LANQLAIHLGGVFDLVALREQVGSVEGHPRRESHYDQAVASGGAVPAVNDHGRVGALSGGYAAFGLAEGFEGTKSLCPLSLYPDARGAGEVRLAAAKERSSTTGKGGSADTR